MRPVWKAARLALGGWILAAAASQAADPFYVGLMESGSRDYLRGDYPAAAHKLEIACFGLLDEPQLLTRGLIRLALAQAGVRTLSRLCILGNSRKIVHDVRNAFFDQLQRLGASYFDTHRTGDIMSRGVNDIQLLQSFYGPGVLNLLNTTIVNAATTISVHLSVPEALFSAVWS